MTDPRSLLREHGLRPKKSFGQNFLVVPQVVESIAQTCVADDVAPLVVELGAGTGVLTRALLARGAKVVAVERDRDLLPVLRAQFAQELERGQLVLLEADAKAVSIPELLREQGAERCVLAGNLPYQITGALLELATQVRPLVTRVVYLVQKEVALRLVASPRSKDYGALTVFVRAGFSPRIALHVARGAFHPAPAVDSAVVELVPLGEPCTEETEAFRDVVKAAFSQRRKTLRNAWSRLAEAGALAELAERADVRLDARGEELDVQAFARMAGLLELSRAAS